MDLSKYITLTGRTVSDSEANQVKANIRKSQAILETMLGFSLSKNKTNTNFYNEVGKSTLDCFCPNVNTSNLLPPDDVVNSYRLFPYNKNDKFLFIDPFTAINKVKLVYVKQGDPDANGVTIKTFDDDDVRIEVGRNGISKYIQDCEWKWCSCNDVCTSCVQIAVDADWMNQDCVPDDLLYVWADMAYYYSDDKRYLQSESITSHSYRNFQRPVPETEPQNLAVIRRYAGPFGSVTVQPTFGQVSSGLNSGYNPYYGPSRI